MNGLRSAVGGALVALVLVGCTGPAETVAGGVVADDEEKIEEGFERMLEEEASEDGATYDIDLDGGAEVPASWPASVPVPDGEIVLVREQDGGHSLAARVASAEEAQAYVDEIEAAGFTVVAENVSDDGGFRLLEGDGLEISITWTGGDDVLLGLDIRPSSS